MENNKMSLVSRLRTMAKTGWNPIGDEAADQITAANDLIREIRKALSEGATTGMQFAAIEKADTFLSGNQKKVTFGCHVDIEEMDDSFRPDECVIDSGDLDDCVYSRRVVRKEDCEYWQEVKEKV